MSQTNTLELLATNLSGKVRREHRNGREYLVAPASLIVPGVLNGSKGPLYYPEEEINKNYLAWNDMPIVLDHPVDNAGQPISARDPAVLEKFGLGRVYNAKVAGKLESELWFDVADTRRIYPSIISRLEGNQPIELSTGLFTSNETKKGDFNGKAYEGIARNYQPDHLAILPDKVGACSIKDGCGVLANEEKTSLWTKLGQLLGINESVGGATGSSEQHENTATHKKDCDCETCKAGKAELKKTETKTDNQRGESEVTKPKPLTNDERSDVLDQIIANCECWEESDRDTLAKMNDLQLNALVTNGCGDEGHEEEDDEEEEEEEDRSPVSVMNSLKGMDEKKRVSLLKKLGYDVKPVANAEKPAKKTSQQWFDEAPEEVRSVVANAIQFQSEQKTQLISQIVTNSGKKLTKEFLANKDVNELKTLLAALPAPQKKADPVANFFGASAPLSGAYTANESSFKDDEDTDMAPPTINWNDMASEGLQKALKGGKN